MFFGILIQVEKKIYEKIWSVGISGKTFVVAGDV